MRRFASLTLVGTVALGTLVVAPAAAAPARTRVIVVLDDRVAEPGAVAAEMGRRHGGHTGFVYRSALKGFSMELPAPAVAALARDHRVRSVEQDQAVQAMAQSTPTGVRRIFAPANPNLDIDGTDDERVDVDVAVIDSGIDMDHPDLNVVGGTDCASGPRFSSSCAGTTGEDANGHGTHVAGSIGALDDGNGVVGVAPGARLHAVRVLDSKGSGQISWIVAGIDWVTARAADIEVANMSLGCECSSSAMDSAIARSVDAGVTYAVAAGNSDKNASTFSPANHPDVITVSALADFNGLPGGGAAATCRADQDDTLADFSNFGSTVEIAAPGVCIHSTWLGGGYNTISGTSMASPHVAGAAALLASARSTTTSQTDADAIRATLIAEGNTDWTDDSGDGTKERLLDVSDAVVFDPATTGEGGGGGGGENAPPSAAFDVTCSGLTCSFDAGRSTDADGTITAYSWAFGDGTAGSGATPSHTYASANTYTVTLTVTDDDLATDDESQSVTVTAPSSGVTITSATPYKVKGVKHVDLTWSGATTTAVDVRRDGAVVATTANQGSFTDNIGSKGGGSYTYRICEAGTDTCSASRTVTF